MAAETEIVAIIRTAAERGLPSLLIRIGQINPAEESSARLSCTMVEQMRLRKSNGSGANELASDLRLPVFHEPQMEHWPLRMTWEEAMRNFAPVREHYMRHFDSPEKRLRNRNPHLFSLS